jgi:hypothetical protein
LVANSSRQENNNLATASDFPDQLFLDEEFGKPFHDSIGNFPQHFSSGSRPSTVAAFSQDQGSNLAQGNIFFCLASFHYSLLHDVARDGTTFFAHNFPLQGTHQQARQPQEEEDDGDDTSISIGTIELDAPEWEAAVSLLPGDFTNFSC